MIMTSKNSKCVIFLILTIFECWYLHKDTNVVIIKWYVFKRVIFFVLCKTVILFMVLKNDFCDLHYLIFHEAWHFYTGIMTWFWFSYSPSSDKTAHPYLTWLSFYAFLLRRIVYLHFTSKFISQHDVVLGTYISLKKRIIEHWNTYHVTG